MILTMPFFVKDFLVTPSAASAYPLLVAELHAQFADRSACEAQAEFVKLEQAVKAKLRGQGY